MKLSQEQFRERLVDYLYGQLEGESLREFEACLRESVACRTELEAMQRTLERAREGIRARAPDEAPPRAVRASVMAAAQAQARALALDRPVAAAAAAPRVREPDARTSEPTGIWSWLRAPWLMPTLGVATAVALLVFAKEVEAPHSQRNASRSAPPASEEAEDVSAGQGAPSAAAPTQAPSAPAPTTSEPVPHPAKPSPRAQAVERREGAKAAPGRARNDSKGYAEPPRSWSGAGAEAKSAADRAGPADGLAEAERSDDANEPSPAREQSANLARDKLASTRGAGPSATRSQAEGGGGLGAVARAGGYAQPPPPAAPAAPSAASATVSAAPVTTERARHGADEAADSSEAPMKKSALAQLSRDELWQRARTQSSQHRWTQAIASYRELLRRFPDDRAAPSWSTQVAALEQARARAQEDAGR